MADSEATREMRRELEDIHRQHREVGYSYVTNEYLSLCERAIARVELAERVIAAARAYWNVEDDDAERLERFSNMIDAIEAYDAATHSAPAAEDREDDDAR